MLFAGHLKQPPPGSFFSPQAIQDAAESLQDSRLLKALKVQEKRAAKMERENGPREENETIPIDLPTLYEIQRIIEGDPARFQVLDIGRRAGKTYLGVHRALKRASKGQLVGWFSPTYKYLVEAWRDLKRPVVGIAHINNTERRIEFANGGVIEAWSMTDPDAGRSRKYHQAIVDEAAKAPHLKVAWEESIRPTLTDYRGDALFLSTPKGLNYFYDLYQRGQDPLANPDWQSWKLPSSVNPFLDPEEIEAARAELPELVFKQEYLAEFLSGEGAVFRNVDACLLSEETTPAEHKGHIIVGGLDWAKLHDFTVISLLCIHCEREVFLDRFNKIGWDFQRERILASLLKWGVEHVIVETNSIGSPNLEALRDAAPESIALAGFETTVKSKGGLIQSLALAFEKEMVQWLADPVARHELVAYEATVTETGYTKYGAPEGQWDDTVIARALAWKAARHRIPRELTEDERQEAALPLALRREHLDTVPPSFNRDFKEMIRNFRIEEHKKQQGNDHWSSDVMSAKDDVWRNGYGE